MLGLVPLRITLPLSIPVVGLPPSPIHRCPLLPWNANAQLEQPAHRARLGLEPEFMSPFVVVRVCVFGGTKRSTANVSIKRPLLNPISQAPPGSATWLGTVPVST